MEFCSFCYHPHIRWIILIPFVISIQKQYPSIGQCCHREISLCAERQLACGNLPFDTGTPQVIAKDSLSAENYKVTVPPRTYTAIKAAVTVEKKRSDIPYTTIAPVQFNDHGSAIICNTVPKYGVYLSFPSRPLPMAVRSV